MADANTATTQSAAITAAEDRVANDTPLNTVDLSPKARANTCDVAQRVKSKDVVSEKMAINTKRLRDLTQQIQATTDCDALKLIIHTHVDEFKELATQTVKQQLKIQEKILPITKPPAPNPFSIIKWIAKLIAGTALPQLEAYIKYAMQTVQLISAANQLASTVAQAVPRLKQCALEVPGEIADNLQKDVQQSIEKEVTRLVTKIKTNVKEASCDGQAAGPYKDVATILKGVVAVTDSIKTTKELVQSVDALQTTLEQSLSSSLSSIDSIQSSITDVTGVQPTIDTSSSEAFTQSINNGAFEQLQSDTQAYINTAPPEPTTPPEFTGSPVVGETLSVTQGEWSGDNPITFKYQWYSDGVAINWATEPSFTLTTEELGREIYCEVIAENVAAISVFQTPVTEPVTTTFTAPVNVSLPEISGRATVGQTLTVTDGDWDGTPPIEFTYQWQYAKTATDIVAATGNTYTIDEEDIGKTLRCVVTATNPLTIAQAISQPTAIVTY